MSTASVTPTAAGTTTWNIDNSHTLVEFSVRHLMISTVKGRFGEVSGKVVADDADPSRSQIEATINVASIDTREAQRDAHLRSADFFDAENFPTLTFRSTRIEKASGDDLKVTGDLTIRGTTREVVLDVTSEGRVKDPWGGERAGYSAKTKIKRSDFGLTWNMALETGGVVVGDDIKIALEVELVKQA
jgi:polyisoprenoid-binding protein YceI